MHSIPQFLPAILQVQETLIQNQTNGAFGVLRFTIRLFAVMVITLQKMAGISTS